MYDWLITIVAFVAIIAAVWFSWDFRQERKFKAEVARRESLSDEAMFRQYFSADAISLEVPAKIRRVFAEQMGYDAEKLLPDDDMTFYWAELDSSDLVAEVAEYFGLTFTDEELEHTHCTIRDVSRLVASKLPRQAPVSQDNPI